MRDIKFRGKRKDNGEWMYGWLADGNYICDWNLKEQKGYEVQWTTVGQYTGLCDAQGDKIYEGDVLKHMSSNFYGVVKWHKNGYFYIKDTDSEDSHRPLGEMLQIEDFVIIGNIHDNPQITTN